MTPTPEAIAMAERIADQIIGDRGDVWLLGYRTALAAIIEMQERSDCLQHSEYLVGLKEGWRMCRDEDHAAYHKAMESTEHLARLKAIRNGEHLR